MIPLFFLLLGMEAHAPSPKPALACEKGGFVRQFGKSNWLVYGCSDGRSLVVISDKLNPAAPFVFIISQENGSYHIYGEGNGEKSASDAALKELQGIDLKALANEANAAAINQH